MTHQQVHWEDVLRRAGHRATRQRGLILDAVCAGGGHTSLGEVYARAKRRDRALDRSTVYRALKVFIETELVVAADTGDGETYYEIKRPQQHHHLVCRGCGWEQEIDASVLEAMVDRVRDQHGFTVVTDHLVLFGFCQTCRQSH
ncbi:MAG TPA: transcriptional repressor [Thermomicrobiales bacterium]|nr:transcriptional repressor [Thermomicrobiales bacterium]